jgi:hypothetical protein
MTNNFNPAKFLLALVIIGMIVGLVFAIAVPAPSFKGELSQHALERHGADAVKAQECFQQNGTMQTWQRPDGRTAYLCAFDLSNYAVSLQDPTDPEPFNYFLQGKTTIVKVMRWLSNSGFTQIQ